MSADRIKSARVGIVMPCFNLGPYIQEALDSLYAQTFKDYVVYIIDDASTDENTLRTLKEIEPTLPPNFTIDYQKTNRGMNKVSNYAAEKIDAEYLFIFSPDDILKNTFLEETVAFMDTHQSSAAVCTWLQSFGEYGHILKYYEQAATLPTILIKNEFCGSSLIRKDVWDRLGGYDENPIQKIHQDYEFWIRVLSEGYKLSVIEKPLFLYRVRFKSLSRTPDTKLKYDWVDYVTNKHRTLYEKHAITVIAGMHKQLVSSRIGREAALEDSKVLKKKVAELQHDAHIARRIKSHWLYKYFRWLKKIV